MAFFNFLSSFAPNNWAIIIPIPIDNPIVREFIKIIVEPVEPTAPRATFPTNLPTIIESERFYICWKKFPINNGMAKQKNKINGSPSVISIMNLSFFRNLSPIWDYLT